MLDSPASNRFERHPRLWGAFFLLVLFIIVFGIFEVVLRISTDYAIDFYTYRTKTRSSIIRYPYGEVPINSLGYADEEFNLASDKPRVGYFGDSVNFGVGAGYPYRVSELVERAYPQLEHWNLGGGLGAGPKENRIGEIVREFNLDYAVYLLNLNDIVPVKQGSRTDQSTGAGLVFYARKYTKEYLDFFREKSYVYNFLRFKIKNVFQRMGYGGSGHIDYVQYPSQYEDIFKSAIESLNIQADSARQAGAEVCVILLPEEMQVSKPAARKYKELGFNWEDGFESGSAQQLIGRYIRGGIHVHDPLPSFAPFDAEIGTYFVYNRGDSIDWNHPTRLGHAVIAKSFMASRSCPFLSRFQPVPAG